MFAQLTFIQDPVANDVKYQGAAQPFLVFRHPHHRPRRRPPHHAPQAPLVFLSALSHPGAGP
eukprot:scaffold99203_cov63-Phaeocystis_antarctica.AAC.1